MSTAQQVDVLFGVEIEFLAEYLHPGDPLYQRNAEVRKSLSGSLASRTKLPIAGQCTHDLGTEGCAVCKDAPQSLVFDGGRVFTSSTSTENAEFHTRYQHFFVQMETLPDISVDNRLKRTGIEISSPVFRYAELAAGLPQLSQIVAALGQSDNKVMANKACGLHIHVGLRNGMTLLFAKKLVTVVLLLERSLLQALLPASRCSTKWTRLVTKESLLAKRGMNQHWIDDALKRPNSHMSVHIIFTRREIRPAAWNDSDPDEFYDTLRLFWQTDSLENMNEFLRGNGVAKLGLALLLRGHKSGSRFEGGPSTFEFRYPQMSFHLPYIRNWAAISCRIAEIAMLDPTGFRNKAKNILNVLNIKSGPQLYEDLLTAIDLEVQIPEWRAQLERYEQGKDLLECPAAE